MGSRGPEGGSPGEGAIDVDGHCRELQHAALQADVLPHSGVSGRHISEQCARGQGGGGRGRFQDLHGAPRSAWGTGLTVRGVSISQVFEQVMPARVGPDEAEGETHGVPEVAGRGHAGHRLQGVPGLKAALHNPLQCTKAESPPC